MCKVLVIALFSWAAVYCTLLGTHAGSAQPSDESQANSHENRPADQESGEYTSSQDERDLIVSITREQQQVIDNRAFVALDSVWDFKKISVCWENASDNYLSYMEMVRTSVANTWARYSALSFTGWQECNDDTLGIRILIQDTGPHVKDLGKKLDGMENGMVLNFDFNRWSQSCRNARERCVRSIAVHEFGHAIGFAHEQNSPFAPGECAKLSQGPDTGAVQLTPWDLGSAMNYCNPVYNNDGQLSDFDKVALKKLYGEPR